MKLVIPKSIANVHLLQGDSNAKPGSIVAPLNGPYPVFYDGARSDKKAGNLDYIKADLKAFTTMPLGTIIETFCQLALKQLHDMMELLGKMNNVEKKQQIIVTCLRIREMAYKMTILTDFVKARHSDLHLASMGLRVLKCYDMVLTQIADSCTVSLDQASSLMLPALEVGSAIKLLTGVKAYNLPQVFESQLCTIDPDTIDRTKWIGRLNNLLKRMSLEFSKNLLFSIESVDDGVLMVLFANQAKVGLTLVPLFESSNYAWHILSLEVPWITHQRIATSLLIHFQAKYNGRPCEESKDLLLEIGNHLSELKLKYSINRLLDQFEDLPMDIKVIPITTKEITVQIWNDNGPKLILKVDHDKSGLTICSPYMEESVIEIENVSFDTFALEQVDSVIAGYTKEKLCNLKDSLLPHLSSWPLFHESQVTFASDTLSILMPTPGTSISITVSRITGKFIVDDSDLEASLNLGDVQKFLKLLRTIRQKFLYRGLKGCPMSLLVILDPTYVTVAQLSPFQVPFAFKALLGKLVILDFTPLPRVYFAIEERIQGRYHLTEVSPLINDLDRCGLFELPLLVQALENLVASQWQSFVELEFDHKEVMYERIGEGHWKLLNLGTIPSVSCIEFYTSPGHCSADVTHTSNPSLVNTTLGPVTKLNFDQSRIDIGRALISLKAFLSLMTISKQLELLQISHSLDMDSIEFATSGKNISIITDISTGEFEFPLSLAIPSLTPETLAIVQNQLRSSLNIRAIVNYLNSF